MKYILLLTAFVFTKSVLPAQTLVSNSGFNILYAGITNKISVLNAKVDRRNLKIHCPDFIVIDSNGYYYIPVPKLSHVIKETRIIVSDKRKGRKSQQDTFYFRIKKLPEVKAQMGSLTGGDTYSFGELAIQSKMYAVMQGVYYDGIKYSVLGYDYMIINGNDFSRINGKVQGDFSPEFLQKLSSKKDAAIVIFDNIKVALANDPYIRDTMYVKPIVYKLKGTYNLNFVLKGDAEKSFHTVEFINAVPYGSNGCRKVNYYLCSGADTVKFASVYDSLGRIYKYEKYHLDIQESVKFSVEMADEGLAKVRFFDFSGFCYAEGYSVLMDLDPFIGEPFFDLNEASQDKDFEKFLIYNRLYPRGTWIFHFKESSNFMTISFVAENVSERLSFETVCRSFELKELKPVSPPAYFNKEGWGIRKR